MLLCCCSVCALCVCVFVSLLACLFVCLVVVCMFVCCCGVFVVVGYVIACLVDFWFVDVFAYMCVWLLFCMRV